MSAFTVAIRGKADMRPAPGNVCFLTQSGHWIWFPTTALDFGPTRSEPFANGKSCLAKAVRLRTRPFKFGRISQWKQTEAPAKNALAGGLSQPLHSSALARY